MFHAENNAPSPLVCRGGLDGLDGETGAAEQGDDAVLGAQEVRGAEGEEEGLARAGAQEARHALGHARVAPHDQLAAQVGVHLLAQRHPRSALSTVSLSRLVTALAAAWAAAQGRQVGHLRVSYKTFISHEKINAYNIYFYYDVFIKFVGNNFLFA